MGEPDAEAERTAEKGVHLGINAARLPVRNSIVLSASGT